MSGRQPQYTEAARKERIQGIVITQALIDESGDVAEVWVLKPLPLGLDLAAIEAICSWKYKPATLDGRPVPVYFNLTTTFSLE